MLHPHSGGGVEGEGVSELLELHIGPAYEGGSVCSGEVERFSACLRSGSAQKMLVWWHGLTDNGQPPEQRALRMRALEPFVRHVALINCDAVDEAGVHIKGAEVELLLNQATVGGIARKTPSSCDRLLGFLRQTHHLQDCVRYQLRTLSRSGNAAAIIGVLELPVRANDHPEARLVLTHIEEVS